MFQKKDKLRNILSMVKRFLKKEALYVTISGQKCKILGRVGTFHVTADITGKDIKIGDKVEFEVKPIFVNPNIRREYV